MIEKSNQVRLAATGALNRSKVAKDMARQSLSNSNQAIQGQQRDSFENYIKTSRKAFNQAVEFHSQVEDIVHPILMQLDQLDGTLKELAQDFILSNEDILDKAKKALKTLSHEAASADMKSIFAFNASKECLMTLEMLEQVLEFEEPQALAIISQVEEEFPAVYEEFLGCLGSDAMDERVKEYKRSLPEPTHSVEIRKQYNHNDKKMKPAEE